MAVAFNARGRSFADGPHRRLLPEAYAAKEGAPRNSEIGTGNKHKRTQLKAEHLVDADVYMEELDSVGFVIQKLLFDSHSCKFIYTTSF